MRLVYGIAYLILLLYYLVLWVRLVLDLVQMFARDWKPRGVVLVLAEAVYTVTDPPLRWLRQRIKPLRIGGIALDLAFLILMVACTLGLTVLQVLRAVA